MILFSRSIYLYLIVDVLFLVLLQLPLICQKDIQCLGAGHPLHEIVQRFIIKPEGPSSVIGR